MRVTSLFALTLAASVGVAHAADNEMFGSDGHVYEQSCNDNGVVLTSKYPFAIYEEAGAATTFREEKVTIYLGRSCDAQSDFHGAGKWCWANGGTMVEFEYTTVPFARQTPFCANDETILDGCSC